MKPCNRYVLAIILATLAVSPGVAQEASPCEDGRSHVIRQWSAEGVPGSKDRPTRTSILCLPDGGLRQVVEVWKEKSRSWVLLFESTFHPEAVGEIRAVPVRPPEPPPKVRVDSDREDEVSAGESEVADEEPAREPLQPQATRQGQVEGSSVTAASRVLQREEIPEEQTPELVMASPMVLEVTPGNVDEYPENAGWRSEETAFFICNEIIIKQVGMGRKTKGDSIELIVEAKMFSEKRQRQGSLLIEVIHDGEVVVSDLIETVRVGIGIPAQGETGAMYRSKTKISRELFEEMFAGDSVPLLRYTLTVPPQ